MSTIPIIDISPIILNKFDANDKEVVQKWKDVSKQIDTACRSIGFFYVKGHGIEDSRMKAIEKASRDLFNLPLEEKNKISITQSVNHRGYGEFATEKLSPDSVDNKETFDLGQPLALDHPLVADSPKLHGPNQYPEKLGSEWQKLVDDHFYTMLKLGTTILSCVTLSLDLPIDFFEDMFKFPMCAFRMIHYPGVEQSGATDNQGKVSLSAGEHTDYGCITLLCQDTTGGLQVGDIHGNWINAVPIKDTFVVNIGDMLNRWTNGIYHSTPHRVLSPKQDRFSYVFFFEPHYKTPVTCLPSCSSAENPPKYEPILAGDYLMSRFADTYTYYKK
ncbi:hypothetical protein CYY_007618 [Polysphondylium violaceum]|uniref:Fe2OG dioxygenase domain-containing protein n=1 Tax=Polysphondylium violaceum TaxID=133409 RepID=A0A8J4PPE4_9MYCE|nr:hypothetical protein CYY_007618 [Polysphondylium violaceum]